jgi:hypothetical protein
MDAWPRVLPMNPRSADLQSAARNVRFMGIMQFQWNWTLPMNRVYCQTSEQLGYGDPSNGEFKSLAVVLCFLRFLLFSPQKATKRTKKKGIGSARLEGPFGHFF